MNILIYFGNQINPMNGGTERVAYLLSNHLKQNGHKITHICCYKSECNDSVPSLILPDRTEAATPDNISFVKDVIRQNNIDLILNEGGNGESIYLFSHKTLGPGFKIISHIHFDIYGDYKYFYKTLYLPILKVSLTDSITNIFKRIKSPFNRYRALKSKKARFSYMLSNSDLVIVLAKKHISDYKNLIKRGDFTKLVALRNPFTFEPNLVKYEEKDNMVLFVGRLDYKSKRVDRILHIWKLIQDQFPSWRLSIVGDGDDKKRLMTLSSKLGLKNITFEGKTNSEPFYKNAKILVLTSNYEGTPMVIPEAMAYGAVPVIMDSFAGAHDLIIDGYNGCLTKPFNIQEMAIRIKELMSDKDELSRLSKNSFNTFRHMPNSEIFTVWDVVLNDLSKK